MPARGYKFGCVCSYMAGLTQATNLGVFDLCHFALLKRGCTNLVVGLELADLYTCIFPEVVSLWCHVVGRKRSLGKLSFLVFTRSTNFHFEKAHEPPTRCGH